MFKFLAALAFLLIFSCEKPQPQKPNIISSHTYTDSLALDSMYSKKDSTQIDLIPTKKQPTSLANYTNSAKQNLSIGYFDDDSIRKVEVNFKEKNLFIKLNETHSNSNIYANETLRWEGDKDRNFGKLTINGTWFEFTRANN